MKNTLHANSGVPVTINGRAGLKSQALIPSPNIGEDVSIGKNLTSYDNEAMCPTVDGAQDGSEDRNRALGLSENTLSLSPNPVRNMLQVGLPDIAFSKGHLQVWDVLGSQVRLLTLQPGNNQIAIDLSGLPDGNYFLEAILDGQHMPVQRFVKHSR